MMCGSVFLSSATSRVSVSRISFSSPRRTFENSGPNVCDARSASGGDSHR